MSQAVSLSEVSEYLSIEAAYAATVAGKPQIAGSALQYRPDKATDQAIRNIEGLNVVNFTLFDRHGKLSL